jgi:hypothetical protein
MCPLPAKAMVRSEGMCVPAAHMRLIPASRSRTCGRFRPESRPAARKPGKVREREAEKRQETRGSACEMPGNRGMCARTSAGSVPSGLKSGRNQGEVRDSMAQTRGRCVRATHMRPLLAKGMARTRHMCASGHGFKAAEREFTQPVSFTKPNVCGSLRRSPRDVRMSAEPPKP